MQPAAFLRRSVDASDTDSTKNCSTGEPRAGSCAVIRVRTRRPASTASENASRRAHAPSERKTLEGLQVTAKDARISQLSIAERF